MKRNYIKNAMEAISSRFNCLINNGANTMAGILGRRKLVPGVCLIIRLMLIFSAVGLSAFFPFSTSFQSVNADNTTAPSIEVLPSSGVVGTTVYVKIINYTPSKQIIITFGTGTTIGTGTSVGTKTYVATKATTDASGYGVADFDIDVFPAGRYTIMADDGTNKLTTGFKLVPSISLGDVVSGYVGDVISVNGHGFAAKKLIYLGVDDEKIVTGESDDKGQCLNMRLVIPSCSRGNHNIKMQDSENNVAVAAFNVRQHVSTMPASAAVGDTVKIVGSGFASVADVTAYFDDKEVGVVQTGTDGGFTIDIKVPPCGDGVHRIKVDDKTNKGFNDIKIASAMSISPETGFIGMQVGVQGSGFRPGFPVNLSYDNIKLEGTTVQSQGSFTYSFKIPVSRFGPHSINASDGVNSQKAIFTVESTPPMAPTTHLPADGDRAVKDIHFEWGTVNDPSGVTYTFEVADDAKFSNVIMSQANVTANYIDITEDSKMLPGREKPYYWRVKAVDRASNEGAWSLVSSFYKGHTIMTILGNMPDWVKWILVILGLVLFGFMFFWIGHTLKKLRRLDEDEDYEDGYEGDDYNYQPGKNER
ncbi:MAG: hypothetical protein EHM12_01495 [Dehalococcoidia bacterium]|nr:MAG: hypothetical protein EHM12_01495 [Dehalococcoidia bacterium]